jgi:hypothetical protein
MGGKEAGDEEGRNRKRGRKGAHASSGRREGGREGGGRKRVGEGRGKTLTFLASIFLSPMASEEG